MASWFMARVKNKFKIKRVIKLFNFKITGFQEWENIPLEKAEFSWGGWKKIYYYVATLKNREIALM